MPASGKLEPVSCSLCSFSTKRITALDQHFINEHNTTSQTEWNRINSGPIKCLCGCGNNTQWLNWKHGYSSMLKGHNGNIYALYGEEKAQEISQKRKDKLIGQPSWCKGLTKETDERVALRAKATSSGRQKAFDEGKLSIWSKGLTKETDERVAKVAFQTKLAFAEGHRVPDMLGKTKDTDPKIAAMAEKISLTLRQDHLRKRLDDLKRLDQFEVKRRIEENSNFEIVSNLTLYKRDLTPNIEVQCKTCNTRTVGSLRTLQHHRCYVCDPSGSKAQAEVAFFVESLGITVLRNDRTTIGQHSHKAELDIFVPASNFAIEFNGLHWHSEAFKSSAYHQNKSDQCRELGISLVHIFSDEWMFKREIVKSLLTHKLGMTKTKIHGRKCQIKQLSSSEKSDFFVKNHIEGDVPSTTAFGLILNDQIVMAMSVRRPFHHVKHDDKLEIARVSTLINTSVVGGLGKLTKHVLNYAKINSHKSVLSYVDTRFGGTGKSWEQAGWLRGTDSAIRFWWTDSRERFNRFKFRANSSLGLTEAEVAETAGVVKIFGCRNFVYELPLT